MTRGRGALTALAAAAAATAAIAVAQDGGKDEGRIGPDNRIQPSGRLLTPAGKLTGLGNLPAGASLTPNGRYLWTVSAGRGHNDVRIVRVDPGIRCSRRLEGRRLARCRRRAERRKGRVIQTIPLPGASGGIAMAPDGRTAYVSGTPETSSAQNKTPEDTPGKNGDVIHVFRHDPIRGTAERDGLIAVPPPSDAPIPQNFPPTNTERLSWPRDLAVSGDGRTLLAALNLANYAAVVDTESRAVRFVKVGSYPYGAAITRDGRLGLVSNEADGTVSVIDLAAGSVTKTITVGPHLSHPEAIAIDPKRPRAYVAVTHQDLIAVLDLERLRVERTLSVERPEGIGTAPVALSVTRDGCRLLAANSGEDAVAVFSLVESDRSCLGRDRRTRRARRSEARAQRVLAHEGRRGVDRSESAEEEAAEIYGEASEERAEAAKHRRPAKPLPREFELIGRIPVGSYPVHVEATPRRGTLVWVAAKGLGVGRNDAQGRTLPEDTGSATAGASEAFRFEYLPEIVDGMSGILPFPSEREIRRLTPKAARQIRPSNDEPPPPGSPITPPGPSQKIKHVFYVVRENRTYDQILGDDPRGDGDPKLTLFGEPITPNAHALARRFPLLDHVYANSEASIDGHFWTSAAAVSDYVVKSWHQNYAGRKRPYDFGVYAVTWPSQRFLFDQAQRQGISWFNFGEAIAGTVPLADRDRTEEETEEVVGKFAKSDLGPPQGCFSNDASSGGVDEIVSAGPGPDTEVFDSSLPEGAPPGSLSRFDCFKQRFDGWVENGEVPAFVYMTLANDHTAGTRPGRRTPNAMIAENDWALGQTVETISKSPVWKNSLILVIEDDSQDGADHVDAHRIPAFAISPYAKRGAVIHTRYDFLSFIRTLELAIGMRPLNLFDATAVPMYDVFTPDPENIESYDAIRPAQDLVERNTAASPNARLSSRLPLGFTDRTPQRYLDRILWQYVHGADSEPPPPGPNASGLDERAWKRGGAITDEDAREALLEEQEEGEEE